MARTGNKARGKTSKTAKAATADNGAASGAAGPSKPIDVPSLIDKAHTLLAQSNFELAIKFLERALQMDATNLEARELLGVAELEEGDEEAGRQHLLQLFPPHSASAPQHPSPYLYLAQTAGDPHEALGYYSTAAAMIENKLKASGSASGDDEEAETRAMGIRALVAMIEIWMSDLCMEPEAEGNCDSLVARAVSVAPTDTEVQLTLASIRMSQSRFEEAKKVVKGVYERIADLDAFDPTLPPLPTRLLLARQLLEHNLHLSALDIVTVAREEDSLEVESAYLEGWAWYLRAKALAEGTETEPSEKPALAPGSEGADEEDKGPEDLNPAECMSESMRALIECAALYEEQGYPDEGIGAHVAELLEEMKEKGVVPNIQDEEEGEGGEGWEDVKME